MDDFRKLSATLNPEQRQLLMSGLHALVNAFKRTEPASMRRPQKMP